MIWDTQYREIFGSFNMMTRELKAQKDTVGLGRMYTVTLIQGTWRRRLYFRTDDDVRGPEDYQQLLPRVERIGGSVSSMQEFSEQVSDLFSRSGFIRIQK